MVTTTAPPEMWTLSTAATYAELTPRSLGRYIADGVLPAYRLGARQIRVRRADVEALFVRIPTEA